MGEIIRRKAALVCKTDAGVYEVPVPDDVEIVDEADSVVAIPNTPEAAVFFANNADAKTDGDKILINIPAEVMKTLKADIE